MLLNEEKFGGPMLNRRKRCWVDWECNSATSASGTLCTR